MVKWPIFFLAVLLIGLSVPDFVMNPSSRKEQAGLGGRMPLVLLMLGVVVVIAPWRESSSI